MGRNRKFKIFLTQENVDTSLPIKSIIKFNSKIISEKFNRYNSCENCINEYDFEGICVNKTHCDDDLFYGDKCDQPCKNLEKNCKTCDRDENCKSCEDNNYYGNSYSEKCENYIGGWKNMHK